ncbi:MAG: FtsW/RodA/SpoVE family cell cycle protein [Bacilli bacterium]|nr:FtsW/RodA/SpoVE family cell cycle protein [Bacilli bacterium]MBP3635389.1 FtsW/RodA/SpoVE family cell cycle protein [Bacilli bacterium]
MINKTNKTIINNLKLIIPIILFMVISIFSIFSSQKMLSASYNDLYVKQLIWYLIGFICIIIIAKGKSNFLYEHADILFIISNVFLLLVLFFGTESNGAKCWFTIPGIGSFQPSEFVKIFLILVLAKELDKYGKKNLKRTFKNEIKVILKCFVITLIPSILTFLEPDTGIIFIFFSIMIVMLFIYGIRYRWFITLFVIIGIFGGVFLGLFFFNQNKFIDIFGTNFFYRMDRILDWQNGSGMQLTNALAATGSAGLFGHGFASTPIYFPEPQTDFIFSVFTSNFGFIASILLIAIILYFDMQLVKIAMKCKGQYKYIISGILAMLIFQQIQNIGMNIGILPITGITLPFISYGGSSLISYMIIIGITINIINNKVTL